MLSAGDGRYGVKTPVRPPHGKRQDCRIASRAQARKPLGGPFSVLRILKTISANKKPLRCSSRRLWTGLFRKSAERCANTHLATNVRNGEIVQISLKRLDLREQIGCLPPRRDFRPWRHGRTDHRRNGMAGQARKRVKPAVIPFRRAPLLLPASSRKASRAFILLVRCSCHSLTDAQPWLSIQRYPPATRRLTRRLENQLKPLGKQLGTNGLPVFLEHTGGTSGADGFEDKMDKIRTESRKHVALRQPTPPPRCLHFQHNVPVVWQALRIQDNISCPPLSCFSSNPVVLSCLASCPELFFEVAPIRRSVGAGIGQIGVLSDSVRAGCIPVWKPGVRVP